MELHSSHYEVDGESFTGYFADGSGGRRVPGILVAHDGIGLTEHTKDRARALARLGYVAFAMDIYGEGNPPMERAKLIVKGLRTDRAKLRRRAGRALEVLRAHPGVDAQKLAAIGYCFGGTAMIELARNGAALACVVGFHPGLDLPTLGDASAIKAKLLVCVGDKDPIVSAAHRAAFQAEMADANVDWQLSLYGGAGHSFTNPEIDAFCIPGFNYNATAQQRSWQAMRALLDEVFEPREQVRPTAV